AACRPGGCANSRATVWWSRTWSATPATTTPTPSSSPAPTRPSASTASKPGTSGPTRWPPSARPGCTSRSSCRSSSSGTRRPASGRPRRSPSWCGWATRCGPCCCGATCATCCPPRRPGDGRTVPAEEGLRTRRKIRRVGVGLATMAVEMELVSVEAPERPTRTPVVILRETTGQRRILPIFIGTPEAQAIALSLQKIETPRPMTHDLMKNLLEEIGARVERITVTALRDGTFYAEIALSAHGEIRTVSSRPSDAIALAIRIGSPIYAEEEVLDEAGRIEQPDEEQAEQMVEEFREFIDHVNPEDFAT